MEQRMNGKILVWVFLALAGAVGVFFAFQATRTVIIYSSSLTGLALSPGVSPSQTNFALPTGSPAKSALPKIEVLSNSTGYLNVRNAPSVQGSRTGQVLPKEQYEFTEVKNGWYHIILPGGKDGWVSGSYVKIVPSS
ncbi:MAG: hypothetical protein A3E07_03590 [Candidatus Wildermuthbacteria bacterium RIFCSPHIGHO2_12_FULL_45_9]|nr:MAG: hypothetical protein A3E07_03590 [Candidatus Wildermuthbacteria bacterium RIFCSPHIGHO2_12_FULL_45_9]